MSDSPERSVYDEIWAQELECLRQSLDVLKCIQSDIAKIVAALPTPEEEKPRTKQRVVSLEHYISGSGNPTWKAYTVHGDVIYLRQAHRDLLIDVGVWSALNEMEVYETRPCLMFVDTIPDGDFLKPVAIDEGWHIDPRDTSWDIPADE